ncbi:hypothetical protein WJR50_03605 [Catalinimonas sp. 4WD22]|uniref:hypothetical protein n=1 Tax=Catalinimonas locisalis TaxID=3133978 RepID=UPI003100D8DD
MKVFAQAEWDLLFKGDYDEAIEAYNYHFQNKEYKKALPYLEWMLSEHPDANAAQYTMGIELYEKLAEEETNTEKAFGYVQSALNLYDQRLEYFGDTINTLNRKFNTAFKLLYKDSSRYEYLYSLNNDVLERTEMQYAYYNFMPYAIILQSLSKNEDVLKIEEVQAELQKLANITAYHSLSKENTPYERAFQKVKMILKEAQLH